jgi:hypothetical protein
VPPGGIGIFLCVGLEWMAWEIVDLDLKA